MSFKDISYLELWWSLCSVERNNLCNSGEGHHEEQNLLKGIMRNNSDKLF